MQRMIAASIFVLLLSGCSSAPTENEGDPVPSPSTTATADVPEDPGDEPGPTPIDGTSGFVMSAFWTNCNGFRTSVPGLTAMFDFPPPPAGWEDDNPATEFDNRFYQCERVSWGPFERGPVNIILELGGPLGYPPAGCQGNASTLFRPVATIWFSDPDLALYAKDTYHMNAFYGEFNVTMESTGGVSQQRWTWAVPGLAPSMALFPDADVPTSGASHSTRAFWFHDEHTYAVDLLQDWQIDPAQVPGGAFRPASGRFEEPMLFATASDQREYAGRSERYLDMGVTLTFNRYGDLSCESPFP